MKNQNQNETGAAATPRVFAKNESAATHSNPTFAIAGTGISQAMVSGHNYASVREGYQWRVTHDGESETLGYVQWADKIKLPKGKVRGKGELVTIYFAFDNDGCVLSTHASAERARQAVKNNAAKSEVL